jgi:hypothetical protein
MTKETMVMLGRKGFVNVLRHSSVLLYSSDFPQNRNTRENVVKKPPISIMKEIHMEGAELLHTERQTDLAFRI